MHRHPYFDLWLHDSDELIGFIGSPIVERFTIHEWPLSCVQRLKCENGQSHIYKVQALPTVEPTFYGHARSPLLVGAQVLPIDGMPAALLLEDVQSPCLSACDFSRTTLQGVVDTILFQIAHIEGDLPSILDIRTNEQWCVHAQSIVRDVRALVDAGIFQRVTTAMVDQIACCSCSAETISALAGPTGYVHHDLRAENILVLKDSYKVLDWQRPIWGPTSLDHVTVLESVGIAPAVHMLPGVLQLRTLLLIGWFARAARYLFPAGAETYDIEIARLVRQLETTPISQSDAGYQSF
jgi:hypothetical protein